MKYQGDVRAPEVEFKGFQSKPYEVEERREPSEASVHRLQELIKQQRDNREGHDRYEPGCIEQPSANEGLGKYRR